MNTLPEIQLYGETDLYAAPKHHPITGANPNGYWKIDSIRVEISYHEEGGFKIWIRNTDSMWFNAKHCLIDYREYCQKYVENRTIQNLNDSLYFQVIV